MNIRIQLMETLSRNIEDHDLITKVIESRMRLIKEVWKEDSCSFYSSGYHVDSQTPFFTAFDDNKCIGLIILDEYPDDDEAKYYVRIYRLILLAEYQNCNVGELLLDEMEKYYKNNGKKMIYVTNDDNLICPNVFEWKLYKKAGFFGFDRRLITRRDRNHEIIERKVVYEYFIKII